ncbi:MFS transporter TsgA [Buchnera aphidicola (Pemphigus obesinymphae)]|uniref:MFS transporter TsgA n=1 Tax=Buchnera aphidicola TaxID=9 RepID=UPI0022379958|nr:MFS transporter TsgA [Buchnera aphidicola]MCW5196431.1 MFS transporter TsgA [Buchnera aphidicola (Pemphigus obesinymphae)]
MTRTNRISLIWISFFSYALTGALIVVTGLIMGNVSEYFKISLSYTSNIFTFLNAGILISIFLNAWLMEIIPLKKQIIVGFFLMVLSICVLILNHNLIFFSFSIFMLGIISGITMSIGTFLITHLYTGNKRASLLLLTDSFFSMSGMFIPICTTFLLKENFQWYWVYTLIGIIYLFIFLLTIYSKFPNLNSTPQEKKIKQKEKYSTSTFLLSLSALCYILGQLGFISWIPEFSIKLIGTNIVDAGKLVSNFWMAYMFGMWCFSGILKFFDLQRMMFFLTGISCVLMYLFIQNTNYEYLKWIIILLGFFSSAIYTLIITLGSLQTKKTSPKVINFILTSGTIGTLLTFIITSPIVAQFGIKGALFTANILYLIVFILCFILGFFSKHRKYS